MTDIKRIKEKCELETPDAYINRTIRDFVEVAKYQLEINDTDHVHFTLDGITVVMSRGDSDE